ncbi:MAG: hypothetical protein ACUVTX_04425 [Bacteroidales bacterium]
MNHSKFDRNRLVIKKLSVRKNSISVKKNLIFPGKWPVQLNERNRQIIRETTNKIVEARKSDKPVIMAFGAHLIKNGLAPVLINLIAKGWITHLATNGAGSIHDWELSFQGETGEDVRENVSRGEFGIWYETGKYLNMALLTGAYEGKGYGESVGGMIYREGIHIPDPSLLINEAGDTSEENISRAAAAIDLLSVIRKEKLNPGFMKIPHPFKKYSVQCAAMVNKIPFTVHPMFGHDIIYTHPMNHGAAIGRTALTDFLYFSQNISNIDGGVYLSVGSAVMSPMIFEKALSMAQNISIQQGRHIDNHFMVIVDLVWSDWDWKKDGEPPADNPAYYLRFNKTFSRMGGEMRYVSADNRDFLCGLSRELEARG